MAKIFNSVVETAALRGLCSKNRAISGYFLSQVREDFFYNEESKEVFLRIQDFFSKKGELPAFRLLSEDLNISEDAREFLKSGEVGLVKTREQAEQVVHQLDEYRKTREMYTLATGILKRLEKPKVNIEDLASKVADRLTRIRSRKTTENHIFHLGKDSNAMQIIEDILFQEDQDQCIPTGFRDFDSVSGGMFRGSLVILGATSGSGKSMMANQLCVNQARLGYKPVLVPLEMTQTEMLARTIASITGLDSIDVFLKKLATGEKEAALKRMKRFDRSLMNKNGRYTIFKPQEDMSMEELLSALHSINSDVIYIDYATLLKGADGEDQWRKLGQIARMGKIYAENHNKVVVLLCQLSDDGRIRYSQAIKEHASLAWIWNATKDSRERGYLNIDLLKARNQVMKPFTVKVDYARMRVTDLEPNELKEVEAHNKRRDQKMSSHEERFKPAKKTESEKDYLPDL